MGGDMCALAAYPKRHRRDSFFGLSALYAAGCPMHSGYAAGTSSPSATGPEHAHNACSSARPFMYAYARAPP
eukprot:9316702-Prorocentrum_lima.AAC.1